MPMVMERQTVAASNKKAVQTDAAPKALGPYSQAIVANGMVFCAGQIPLDPATGDLLAGGIAEQTHQVLKNLRAVLKAAGSDLDRAVKTTVFLKSMDSFVAMNEVYGRPEYFGSNPPARSTVEVARLPRALLFLAIARLLAALVLIIPTWRICTRAGFSGALSLFHLVPVIGSFIVMAVLAFSDWPNGEASPARR